MNWVDYIILAIVAISALISLVRGFVREVISIVVWVAAFWLAIEFARPLSGWLAPYIDSPTLQLVGAFAILFVGTLLAGALVNYLAGLLVGTTGLSGTDRALGVVFGAARGVLIVAVLMLLLGLTHVPREPWWQESVLVRGLQPLVCQVGVGEWMNGLVVYTPVAHGLPVAAGKPAQTYWAEFCGHAAQPGPVDPQSVTRDPGN